MEAWMAKRWIDGGREEERKEEKEGGETDRLTMSAALSSSNSATY